MLCLLVRSTVECNALVDLLELLRPVCTCFCADVHAATEQRAADTIVASMVKTVLIDASKYPCSYRVPKKGAYCA